MRAAGRRERLPALLTQGAIFGGIMCATIARDGLHLTRAEREQLNLKFRCTLQIRLWLGRRLRHGTKVLAALLPHQSGRCYHPRFSTSSSCSCWHRVLCSSARHRTSDLCRNSTRPRAWLSIYSLGTRSRTVVVLQVAIFQCNHQTNNSNSWPYSMPRAPVIPASPWYRPSHLASILAATQHPWHLQSPG